jgi:hypothetical protein
MKKVKRLVLCRETLRLLERPVLVDARGGVPPATKGVCVQTGPVCEYTYSCPENCPTVYGTC